MSTTPHTPRIEELLPAYALGALDGEDLRELEAHWVSGCEDCRRQLALWEGDLEALAAGVEPVQPSDVTRARVLRLAGSVVDPSRMTVHVRPTWLGIAAAAVLLALALWGLLGQARMERQVRSLEAERDLLSRQVNGLEQQVGLARDEARRAQQALQVLAAPGVQSVVLAGLGPSPGAKGRTYVNPSTRDALFYAFDLPALPADKTYELWFIAAGKPVAAGTFDVDPRGTGTVRVERVTDASQIQAWAVTIEPRGGVPQPTGAMVLKG
jgi:anti-sigma-K factor RskA